MREIIFRGKRKDNGEWVYGGIICWNGLSSIVKHVQCINDNWATENIRVIPETVGQFTGVIIDNREYAGYDKEGKVLYRDDPTKLIKIFEDDRIKVRWLAELGITEFDCETVGTVKYLTELGETAGWYIVFDKPYIRRVDKNGDYEEDKLHLVQFNDDMTINYEKIGNIHDKKEEKHEKV